MGSNAGDDDELTVCGIWCANDDDSGDIVNAFFGHDRTITGTLRRLWSTDEDDGASPEMALRRHAVVESRRQIAEEGMGGRG